MDMYVSHSRALVDHWKSILAQMFVPLQQGALAPSVLASVLVTRIEQLGCHKTQARVEQQHQSKHRASGMNQQGRGEGCGLGFGFLVDEEHRTCGKAKQGVTVM
jgi:hypothetical protein